MSMTKMMVSGLFVVVISGTGCAATTPYIWNDLDARVAATPSPFHEFTYVRVYEKRGELVVYGKVRHEHEFCEDEGYVDLVVEGHDGVQAVSLPLLRQSYKRHGWYGAGFRARLGVSSPPSSIRLAFHDDACHVGDTFDCGDNHALVEGAAAVGTSP